MLSPRETGANQGVELARSARRILVIRLGALGDVVRTRFAYAGLREHCPEARIDWLVDDRSAPGLVGITGLDRVIRVPRRELSVRRGWRAGRAAARVVRELRERDYDLALDFHSAGKSALLARAAGIPARVGYDRQLAREGAWRLMTHRVGLPDPHASRFERNAALVNFLGGRVSSAPPPLELPDGAGEGLAALPAEFVAVHPGTSPSTLYKRWDGARFAAVIREVYREAQIPSVVTWGPVGGERELAEQVAEEAGPGGLVAPETAGLGPLLALLARAKLFLGGDSGPMHLASLVGRPVVAVFGPTDPVENEPFPGLPNRVLRHDVGCNPCREGCPARTCLAAVPAARVARAALDLIAAETPPD